MLFSLFTLALSNRDGGSGSKINEIFKVFSKNTEILQIKLDNKENRVGQNSPSQQINVVGGKKHNRLTDTYWTNGC